MEAVIDAHLSKNEGTGKKTIALRALLLQGPDKLEQNLATYLEIEKEERNNITEHHAWINASAKTEHKIEVEALKSQITSLIAAQNQSSPSKEQGRIAAPVATSSGSTEEDKQLIEKLT